MNVFATDFEPFGTSHQVTLLVFFAVLAPVVIIGRRVRGTDLEPTAAKAFALLIAAIMVPFHLAEMSPGRFDLGASLPLQLCDVAWMLAVAALWTRNRTLCAITYFWGLLLTSQALATPALSHGFPSPEFFGFWAMHFLIVYAAVFLTWGLGIHPTWAGYRSTVAVTFGWMVSVFLINLAIDTNYGFVNRKPSNPSILDYFGPWPVYLGVEIVICAAVWALMTWPWTRGQQPATRGATSQAAH